MVSPIGSFKGHARFKLGGVNVNVGTDESEDRPATLEDLAKLRTELHNALLDLRRELGPRKPKK